MRYFVSYEVFCDIMSSLFHFHKEYMYDRWIYKDFKKIENPLQIREMRNHKITECYNEMLNMSDPSFWYTIKFNQFGEHLKGALRRKDLYIYWNVHEDAINIRTGIKIWAENELKMDESRIFFDGPPFHLIKSPLDTMIDNEIPVGEKWEKLGGTYMFFKEHRLIAQDVIGKIKSHLLYK